MMEYKANCGLDMALERQKPCLAGGRAWQEGGLEGSLLEREGPKASVGLPGNPEEAIGDPILNGLPPWDL